MLLHKLNPIEGAWIGESMREIAQRRYTWNQIGKSYFDLF